LEKKSRYESEILKARKFLIHHSKKLNHHQADFENFKYVISSQTLFESLDYINQMLLRPMCDEVKKARDDFLASLQGSLAFKNSSLCFCLSSIK